MTAKWIGLIAVVVMAVAIIGHKAKLSQRTPPVTAEAPPRVQPAAPLSESNTAGDGYPEGSRTDSMIYPKFDDSAEKEQARGGSCIFATGPFGRSERLIKEASALPGDAYCSDKVVTIGVR